MRSIPDAPSGFRPLSPLVRWLTGLYGSIGLVSLLSLLQVARLRYLAEAVAERRPLGADALARWLAPDGVRTGELSIDGMLFALLDSLRQLEIAVFVLAVPAGVLTYLVLFRVRTDVVALGGVPRFAKHWIVTGFVVPVLNLVRPYQVVADLWRASAPSRAAAAPVLVRLWWEALLVTNALALAAGWRLARRPDTAAGLIAGTALARLALLTLFVLLVRGFAERLEARAAAREPRTSPLDRLPEHAGVDVALAAGLAVAVAAGALLGGGPLGAGAAPLVHEVERAAVDAARAREDLDSAAGRDAHSPSQPPAMAGADEGSGASEGGVEGGVTGGIAGGLPAGVGGVVVGGSPLSAVSTPDRSAPPRASLERISGDAPRYPKAAREAGLEGTVLLELTISEHGEVVEVRVVQGLPKGLTQAALHAAMTWRFRPVVREGRPVRVVQTVPVAFRLAP
jgi:TonB family protein